MPKHDEPITMAEHDAREKAALIARLTTKDEATAAGIVLLKKIAKEKIGRGPKFKSVDFKLSRTDRAAIVATMPENVSARDKSAWLKRIELALDAHCQDPRLLDGERDASPLVIRLNEIKSSADKLQECLERSARSRVVDHEMWGILRNAYAADGGTRDLVSRRQYWRETVEDKLYERICALAHGCEIALQTLKREKSDADNESERQLIAVITGLWFAFTKRKPAFSNRTDKPTGPFPRHVEAIVAALPEKLKPESVSGFVKRAKNIVLSKPSDGDHKS
jgi:hypothetical protein